MERKIRMRRECPEISWGDWRILRTDQPGVLVMRYEGDDHTLVTLHNFTAKPRAVMLDRGAVAANTGTGELVDLLAKNDSRADQNGRYFVQLTIDGSAPKGLIAMCQDESSAELSRCRSIRS